MTTTLSTTTSSDSLLRLAMRVDAVLSGLCGVALMAAAGPISGLTSFSKAAEFTTGAVFVVYAVVVFLAARLRHVRTAGIATSAWRRCARSALMRCGGWFRQAIR